MWKSLLLLLILLPGLALADSGRILYVSGKVTVERDGKLYRAVKRARVVSGDKISTAADGRLHLRMSDRTLISLKPDTDFVIQEYRFAEAPEPEREPTRTARAQPQPSQRDRSVFNLLKGGFRAITGLIGQRDRSAFGVDTPVATIGIRGTSFIAELEPAGSAPNQAALSGPGGVMLADARDSRFDFGDPLQLAQAGGATGGNGQILTVGVGSGSVVLTTNVGSVVLENGEFGQVFSNNQLPRRITRPKVDGEGRGQGGREGRGSRGDDDQSRRQANRRLGNRDTGTTPNKDERRPSQEADETVTADPFAGPRRDIAVVSGISVNGRNTQTVTSSLENLRVSDRQITGFIAGADREGQTRPAAYILSDGSVVDQGFDPDLQLAWGRWAGDSLTLRFRDGTEQQVALDSAQLHLIASASHGANIAIPATGSREYALIGNTDPTDAAGNIGILGDARLRANFDTQTVQSDLALSVADQVWQASGSGRLGTALSAITPANVFSGLYNAVSVDGAAGGAGEFSGFFTDGARGAGLSYELTNGGNAVHGTAAFGGN